MKLIKYFLIVFILFIQTTALFAQKIKVACIGNSITYGTGLDDRPNEAYPKKLELLLNEHYPGKEFAVSNYGVPGTTMLKDPFDGDVNLKKDQEQFSYWEADDNPLSPITGGKGQYDLALASVPDIVIIKFGTNDARQENWNRTPGYGRSNFYNNYVEFINSFRAINPNITIYICYSLPYFKDSRSAEREQARVIREEVIPLIKQVARKNKVHIIDLQSALYDQRNLTYDDVHPTNEGTTIIANEVFKAIKMNLK